MTQQEVQEFLREQNVKPLVIETWNPGTTILYVIEDMLKKDPGPFSSLSDNKVPLVARVDKPATISYDGVDAYDKPTYKIFNPGNRVDYFTIDPKTKKPVWVDSSNKNKDYYAREGTLFEAADQLFPRSK